MSSAQARSSLIAIVCTVAGAGFAWFVFASCSGAVISAGATYVVVFTRLAPDLRPSRHLVDRDAARLVLRRGGLFLVLGIASAIGFQTDALGDLEPPGRRSGGAVRGAVSPLLTRAGSDHLVRTPAVGAHADAFARGDIGWTRRMLRRSTVLAGVVVTVLSLVLVLIARGVLSLTLGDADPHPSLGLLLALAVTAIVMSLSQPLAMLLNAANVVKLQVIMATAMCVMNLGLSILLVETIGVAGPRLGTAIAQTVCGLIPMARLHQAHGAAGARG